MTKAALSRHLGRLRRDRSGLALIEFAFSLPPLLAIGLYGIEMSNLALANLRMSQVALNLADNSSRVGQMNNLAVENLREVDIDDAMAAARIQGQRWNLTSRGRITLTSLENGNNVQRIHWQRCLGMKSGAGYDSSYGSASVTDGTDSSPSTQGHPAPHGFGPSDAPVNAAINNSGVMIVELNYDYQPVVSAAWLPGGSSKLHYLASYVVRDNRDFTQIYNPAPKATVMTCDKYTT